FSHKFLVSILSAGAFRLVHDGACSPDRLLADRAPRALAGTGIGTGTLAAQRQTTAMAQATVAAQVHQALDAHGHGAAQVALDGVLADLGAQRLDLTLDQVLDFAIRRNTGRGADGLRTGAADAVNG